MRKELAALFTVWEKVLIVIACMAVSKSCSLGAETECSLIFSIKIVNISVAILVLALVNATRKFAVGPVNSSEFSFNKTTADLRISCYQKKK